MKEIMKSFLIYLLPNFILMGSMILGWHILLDKKINFKKIKLYIILLVVMVISIFNYIIMEKFIRIFLLTILLMPCFKILFKENIYKSIITPIFHQFIIFISEFISVIILTIFLQGKIENFIQSLVGIIIVNILVAFISILLIKIGFIRKVYKYFFEITEKIRMHQLIVLFVISILFLNIFVISAYYKINYLVWVLTNILLISVLFIIVIYTLKTQNNYNKVSDKYNIAIKSLSDYENMMTKYRVLNHENKNLLLTIRAMILNKEKDIPKYIDSMIENKYADDEKLMFNISIIPTGGLRGTIYSEIMKIKDNGIKYSLNIDKKIRSIDLIEMDTNSIIDICKIIGVFIDNAIDEVKNSKNKSIEISIFLDNKKLNIKISNNYKGIIEIDKIGNIGYTTKGKGHGYGLSLVKEIVKNNNLFENKQEINNDVFSQILIVKYKKPH